MSPDRPTERRPVESRDPSLSPEANRLLTRELRTVTGRDAVAVPRDRPHAEEARHANRTPLGIAWASNRTVLGMVVLVAVVVGGVATLTTGSWWLLALAFGVLALTTAFLVGWITRLTTETEHLDPAAAARLEYEGVADPDRLVTELVDAFANRDEDRPPGDAPSGDRDARATAVDEDPARASAEQRSAMTPTGERSTPVGPAARRPRDQRDEPGTPSG